jgi:hypothetical protein
MKAAVIATKDAKELKFINELLNKLGISSVPISEKDLKDMGLSNLMKNVDRTKKASRMSIMKKLKVR